MESLAPFMSGDVSARRRGNKSLLIRRDTTPYPHPVPQ
jgi:hypothetical protein